MADRFIIHGAAFNGDGTTSAAAASNGGVGAWNTVTYFEGTTPAYGTLPSGTTVYIRSKDAAGADITVTKTAAVSLGSSAANQAGKMDWVIDGGTVWPGIDGTVTYERSVTGVVTVLSYNNILADNYEKFVVRNNSTNPSFSDHLLLVNFSKVKNALLDMSAVTNTGNDTRILATNGAIKMESCHFRMGAWALSASGNGIASTTNGQQKMRFVNCDFEYTFNGGGRALFANSGNFAGFIQIIGGRIRGFTSTQYLTRMNSNNSILPITLDGVQVPTNYNWNYVVGGHTVYSDGSISAVGIDDLGIGGHFETPAGYITSRTDNNPPTRSAFLPNGALTPWSWRMYARYINSVDVPVSATMMKTYSGAAAVATIKVEFLVSTSVTGVNQSNLWMEVSYVDNATGEARGLSTQNPIGAALPVSTVTDWSSEGWGLVNFTKHKLSLTLPSAVKPESTITVVFSVGEGSLDTTAVYFVDPDFAVTV